MTMRSIIERLRAFSDLLLNPRQIPELVGYKMSGRPDFEELSVGFVFLRTFYSAETTRHIESGVLSALKADYDILTAPEFCFSRKEPFDEGEKDSLVKRLAEATKDKNVLLVPGTIVWRKGDKLFNTAYALNDNNVLCEYHKQRNTRDEEASARALGLKAVEGKHPGVFEWGGRSVGIEICADVGLLKATKKEYDLQLLISCGITWTLECAKYIIVNDGAGPTLRLYTAEGNVLFGRP